MGELVVEVVEASDLMPKDRQGSASPFVEVELDQQRNRTHTKTRDLNPLWNEKVVLTIDPRDLPNKTIHVVVYNDNHNDEHEDTMMMRKAKNNFMGRVRISGACVPLSESQAMVQRYPLDKRGLFSNIKGDIALKVYAIQGHTQFTQNSQFQPPSPPQDINTNKLDHEDEYKPYEETTEKQENKKKKKEKEVRTFYSVGTGTGPAPAAPPPEQRSDFAKAAVAGPAKVMHMQVPGMTRPEFGLVETRPPLAARMGYWGGDKTMSTYDLVEQMHYLYVEVVKARDLPVMDITGSLDPYVEVKVGNYKGVTKHVVKNQNPVWREVFAFSKENLQSSEIEVIVKDKDLISKDDFVGRVLFVVADLPLRFPPDSPLAPQWYKLGHKHGEISHNNGEIMLAVWIGTQADEAFPHAWHSDAHDMKQHSLSNTRSKVYFSPKLFYLRVHVIAAQDLIVDRGRAASDTLFVKVQLGHQVRFTRQSKLRQFNNPEWDDELMFVASEPFDEIMIIGVEDRIGPGKDVLLGRLIISVRDIPQRVDSTKFPDARWFNLHMPNSAAEDKEGEKTNKEAKFSSKIHLRLWLDAGYHVLDESTHFSSDLQSSSKHLRRPNIGILEIGILSARNLQPMKRKDGGMTDAYCVANVCNWKTPVTTCLVHVLFVILVCYPELILPTIFLYLFVIGLWNYRFRPRNPPHMDARLSQAENTHPDELDEEFDTFPTSRPPDFVRMRYDRLRSVAGRVQTVIGDMATQGERALAILSWRDPRATAIVIFIALISAVILYVTPFQVIAVLVGLYLLRHPRLRSKMPSVPVNFFKRLPAKSDMLI
ncbi:C2 calcium/lipid-binding plant phosphoribosyltransferase family protein [Actinidia rufa]|uniref:C2 calcium/lipid-binding plant phosphoribosyltransferase family protein n=1 Tax=Actinidia rufa TaxID=165716 RepID=A0A7J0F9C1_9ERIC|nr:C2 calcium/lipid-binding plant phosphoribosyltransferase family protein [Actinidia rufa]